MYFYQFWNILQNICTFHLFGKRFANWYNKIFSLQGICIKHFAVVKEDRNAAIFSYSSSTSSFTSCSSSLSSSPSRRSCKSSNASFALSTTTSNSDLDARLEANVSVMSIPITLPWMLPTIWQFSLDCYNVQFLRHNFRNSYFPAYFIQF